MLAEGTVARSAALIAIPRPGRRRRRGRELAAPIGLGATRVVAPSSGVRALPLEVEVEVALPLLATLLLLLPVELLAQIVSP
jgi:hypothetical protein